MTAPTSKKRRESDRVFALRKYLLCVVFVIVYLAADRSTVFLQIWSGISAWYPPTGIALALLLGLGVRYAPLYVLAGLLAGRVNYHQAFFTYTFVLGDPLIFGTYALAAKLLRDVFKIDWRLTSIRDVMVLVFVALPASGIAAAFGNVDDHSRPCGAVEGVCESFPELVGRRCRSHRVPHSILSGLCDAWGTALRRIRADCRGRRIGFAG
jgi:hypothetical protein